MPGDQIQFIQFVLGHQLAEVTHEWSARTFNLRDNKLGHKQYSRCCLINANAYQTLRETADAGNKSGDDGFAVSVESHHLHPQIETFLLGRNVQRRRWNDGTQFFQLLNVRNGGITKTNINSL
jgi:hypothetical protein